MYIIKNTSIRFFINRDVNNLFRKFSRSTVKRGDWIDLTTETKHNIEKKWQNHVGNFAFEENSNKPKSYILSMFPYPSGALHMGHVRVYTISDCLARFHRMNGKNVFHPIGWDAFGLPAENAAKERNLEPSKWTYSNIAHMRSQLKHLGCSFDWNREIATCDPNYYKWTQSIFLKLFKKGLAYQKLAVVNWDPVDKTVLADEQVDPEGKSWRSGAQVEKRLLKQWFIRATKFSKPLLDQLDNPQLKNWSDVIKLQKAWIGEVNGTSIDWQVKGVDGLTISVWSAMPENIADTTFIAVTPGSLLDVMQEQGNSDEFSVTGTDGENVTVKVRHLPVTAINPFTGEEVPILVVSGLLPFENGADTYMGLPSLNHIDEVFAKAAGIPVNSQKSLNLKGDSREFVCSEAQKRSIGGYSTSGRLKDWLISRQRYWGTPIPIVHCESCGAVPVPEEQLPVELPPFHVGLTASSDGNSPLALDQDWLNTTCPKCSQPAIRDTDTMDTFVDSSWYYLRYIDPKNSTAPFNSESAEKLMPVDIYIGGKEHAVLHLYYARLIFHFLHEIGLTSHLEPFHRLLVQGMVMGRTFRSKQSGQYLKAEDVDFSGDVALERSTGEAVVVEWEKMSKSKHNGVDPAEMFKQYGVDTTRLLVLSDVAPTSQRNWSSDSFKGVLKWQARLHNLVYRFRRLRDKVESRQLKKSENSEEFTIDEERAYDAHYYHLKSIIFNYQITHQFNVVITKMHGLTTHLAKLSDDAVAFGSEFEKALASQIICLAPIAPHYASELWELFSKAPCRINENSSIIAWNESVLKQAWPEVDEDYKLSIVVSINNYEICTVTLPRKEFNVLDKDKTKALALREADIRKLIGDFQIKNLQFTLYPSYKAQINLVVPGVDVKVENTHSKTKKGKKLVHKKTKMEKKQIQ